MKGFIWRWILNALALYITAFIVDGISIAGVAAALVAAFVWGFVNTVIRPLINLLTLPINIMTVGLFTFVVNGFLLWVVADVVQGFDVKNIWIGILGALVLSLASSILSALIEDN
ncbi:MAG: phage holin family protein [Bacillota bacterium]|nr:phage holin family protein [Bacillota bacterium]MDW7682926.1 phage holin family protein [Bacillota bacterium]